MITRTRPRQIETSRGAYAFFLGIILCAATLRLWRLELPSLWFDEVLVALVAKLPVDAIFFRSMTEDFHPPAFYLWTRLFMSMGLGDAALRIPQAAFGLAGVWLAWRAGREMLSENAGLLLAALVAVQPWHLLLSRQLRPYSIVFFFSLLSFYCLWRGLTGGRRRNLLFAGLALCPPVLFHFSGLLALGGAGLVVCLGLAAWRTDLRGLAGFCLASAIGMAGVLPFLASLFGRESGVTGMTSYVQVLGCTWDRLSELLFREAYPELRLGLAALSLFGLAVTFARHRALGFISLGWFAFPLAALVTVRYSTYFNPWHLTFLLPPLLLWQAQGLEALAGDKRAAWLGLVLTAAGLFWFMDKDAHHYYQPGSYSGAYKAQAASLLAGHSPGTAYAYPESAVSGPLNWYLDQTAAPNPLRAQRLTPQMPSVRLVRPGTSMPDHILYRTPVLEIGPLPSLTRITAEPTDFLAKVNAMEFVACHPVLENVLIAAQAGRPGHAGFVFRNDHPGPQRITVNFGYANASPGNRFAVSLCFDGEAPAASFESVGPDRRGHDKLEIVRERPYETLTVRFTLARNGRSSAFTGEDLEAVRLLDFKVEAISGK